MVIKQVVVVLMVGIFSLAGWQILKSNAQRKPEVLAGTTTKTLEERVKSLENRVYVLEKNAGLITSTSTKTKESFVSLSGGSQTSSDWSKITGTDFTFDAGLYGKSVEVSWQGWIEGAGSVRIYDSTNYRAVDFSEFSSSNDTKKSFYSKMLSIWRGQNQYYLEGKAAGGTVTLSSPRLKVLAR